LERILKVFAIVVGTAALLAILTVLLSKNVVSVQLIQVIDDQSQTISVMETKLEYLEKHQDQLDDAQDRIERVKTLLDLYKKAKESYLGGNYQDAIKYDNEILNMGWSHAAFENKLNSLIQMQNYEVVALFYNKHLDENPGLGISSNVAAALVSSGIYQQDGVRILDRVLSMDSNYFPALNSAGLVNIQQKDYQKAESYFDRVLQVKHDNVPAMNNLAIAKAAAGDVQGALALVDGALSLEPDNQVLAKNRSLFQDMQGRFLGSVSRKELEIRFTDAYIAREQSPPLELGADYVVAKADEFFEKEYYHMSLEYYDSALQLDPDNAGAMNGKGSILTTTGYAERALQYHQQVLAKYPDDLDALVGLGDAYYELEDYQTAGQHYNHALVSDKSSTDAINGIGNVYVRTGLLAAGVSQYEKTLSIDSGNMDAIRGLGYAYSIAGDLEKSKEYYRQVLAARPEDPHALLGVGFVLHLQGRTDTQYFEQAGQKIDLIKELIRTADELYKFDRLDEALTTYELVLTMDSGNANALNGLANVSFQRGDYENAAKLYNETLAVDSDNANALVGLGNVSYRLGDYAAAQDYYNKALDAKPGHKGALIGLEALKARNLVK
jgi:tetratricopeptide (TPR) repeat protein